MGVALGVNIHNSIERIEEICGILNNQVANEDKDKLYTELEKLLLNVTHCSKSADRNINIK